MKTDGIASAASALRYWERRQEVVSNNLANANTDGFKAQRVFARLIGEAFPIPDAATDFSHGTMKPTGNALDLAVGNQAFFVVNTPQGERLSRGGSFRLDPQGLLVDSDGRPLLGEKGPIRVEGADVSIDRTGEVHANGMIVDRLRMETVPAGTPLQHEEGTLFVPVGTRTEQPLAVRDVRQGFIEESNVNSVSTLVDMITVQRNYGFVQKAMTTLDAVRSTISNEIGKPT